MKSLFLQAPSFDGYDGGAGARYQMKREVKSFWYPTWLAQAAAMVEGSKLIDAPPHKLHFKDIEDDVKAHELIVLHTSTPPRASTILENPAKSTAMPSPWFEKPGAAASDPSIPMPKTAKGPARPLRSVRA